MTIPGGRNVVGDVLVNVLATGEGLERSIKDTLEQQRGKFSSAGDEAGREYTKGWREGIERDNPAQSVLKLMDARHRAMLDMGRAFGDDFAKGLRQRMGDRIGAIVEQSFRRQLEAGRVNADNLVDILVGAEQRAREQIAREDAKRIADAHSTTRALAREAEQRVIDNQRAADRQSAAWATYGQNLLASERNHSDSLDAILRRQEEAYRTYDANIASTLRNNTRRVEQAIHDQERAWSTYGENLLAGDDFTRRINSPLIVRALGDVENALGRARREARLLSFSNPFPRSRWFRPLGSILSLASQIPGVLLEGLGTVTRVFGKAAGAVADFWENGFKGAMTAGDLFTSLGKAALKVASSVASAALALGSMAAVAGLLLIVIGPLVSLLFDLAAMVTALAASVGAGIVGAIGAALPILAALAPAIAVVTIAIAGNGDAFKDASKPIVDWYNALKGPIIDGVLDTYRQFVKDLNPLLGAVVPLLNRTVGAIRTGFLSIGQAIQDPQFLASIARLSDENTGLPAITAKMTAAAGNFFTGLTGLLVPLLGPANELADSILSISQRFTDFTNSARGQETLRQWFDNAWTSAKKVGNLLGEVISFVLELVHAGQGTGDTILDRMARAIGQASDWIEKGGLKDFFADAVKNVTPFADVVSAAAAAIASLNTPENQERLRNFEEWLDRVLPGLQHFVEQLGELGNAVAGVLGAFRLLAEGLGNLAPIAIVLDLLTGQFGKAWDRIKHLFVDPFSHLWDDVSKQLSQGIDTNPDWANALGKWIVEGIKNGLSAAWGALEEWWHGVWNGFVDWVLGFLGIQSPSTVFMQIGMNIIQGLWDGVVAVWNGFLGFWGSIPGLLMGALASLPGLLLGWISDAWSQVLGWLTGFVTGQLIPFVTGIPGMILGGVSSLGGLLLGWISEAWSGVYQWVTGYINGTVIPFISGIPGMILGALGDLGAQLLGWISRGFTSMYSWLIGWINGEFLPFIRGIPNSIISAVGNFGSGLISAIEQPFKDAYYAAKGWVDKIKNLPGDILGGALGKVGDFVSNFAPDIPGLMAGGIINRPMLASVGERGLREVVIPLELPLNQVNPAVREMAALVRGQKTAAQHANISAPAPQTTTNVTHNWNIDAPHSDGKAVARQLAAHFGAKVLG